MANYYEILQISPKASIEEIRSAFRRLARQYHPDMNPSDPTTVEKFRQIERAYQVLRDPLQRQRYDRENIPSEPPIVIHRAATFFDRGLRFAKERNYPQAIENYRRAIEIDPTLWPAYMKRAEAYYHNYQDRSVLEDCRQVLQLNPDCGQAYYYLGLSRQRLGYTQSAIEAYHRAIDLDPHPAPIYYQRGLAFEELADYSIALQDFQQAAIEFQQSGNFRRYQSLQHKIQVFKKIVPRQQKKMFFKKIKYFVSSLLVHLKHFLTHLIIR
jgi:curved DNA-binding protein CbpA